MSSAILLLMLASSVHGTSTVMTATNSSKSVLNFRSIVTSSHLPTTSSLQMAMNVSLTGTLMMSTLATTIGNDVREVRVVNDANISRSMSNVTRAPSAARVPSTTSPRWIGILAYTTVPIIFVFGVIGNSLTVWAISTRTLRTTVISRLATCLAVVELAVDVMFPFTKTFVMQLVEFDIRALTTAGSHAFVALYRQCKIYAAWLNVIISVERFVTVCFPTKIKQVSVLP